MSIISILSFSFLHQTKKKSEIAIYQSKKNEGQRVFKKMGLPLSGSSLFIDTNIEPS